MMNESNLKEIRYLIFDFIYFLSPKRKALKSKFSAKLNLNKIRIFIFRLPSYIFHYLNKEFISINSKNNLIDKNFEFYKFNLSIDDETLILIEDIFKSRKKIKSGVKKQRKNIEEENNPVDEKKYLAEYVYLTELETKIIFSKLFTKKEFKEFLSRSSLLAGYKLKQKDIVLFIGKTLGENSNSDWHSDAFFSVIKGFIYLVDISKFDAPFEILKGTSSVNFLSRFYNYSSIYSKCSSPRISRKEQLSEIKNHKIESHIGQRGATMVANTSALHRKGKHISDKERFMLNFEFKRLRLLKRFIRAIQLID